MAPATTQLLIAIPCLGLALNAVAWLHYGIDVPFFDDFRPYLDFSARSLDFKDLLRPSNDTIYAVGRGFDALAQRFLDGNIVAYQLISMLGLLGGLLLLQWHLLSRAIENRFYAAAAFSLCILTMQPGSYWGLQALAYHQGLPLLFLLMALAAILHPRLGGWLGVPVVFLLGILSGLSYISGAVSGLAAGLVLLVLGWWTPQSAGSLRRGGGALVVAGLATCTAQAWVILIRQKGKIHDPNAAWAFPTDLDYWSYLMGNVARALGLSASHSTGAFAIAVIFMCSLLSVCALLLVRMRVQTPPKAVPPATVVILAVSGIVVSYLLVLSAGRAHIGGSEPARTIQVFTAGYEGFHFFWATLLPPWMIAGLIELGKSQPFQFQRISKFAAAAAVSATISLLIVGPTLSQGSYFRAQQQWRLSNDIACVRIAIEERRMTCPWYADDSLLPGLDYARLTGASFMRYFPLHPTPLGKGDPPPLFSMTDVPSHAMTLINTEVVRVDGDATLFSAGDDPVIVVTLPAGTLRQCGILEVSGLTQIEREDTAEIFLLKPDQAEFASPPAASAAIPATTSAAFSQFTMFASSPTGFGDRVRIDPVAIRQPFAMKALEIRCRAGLATLTN